MSVSDRRELIASNLKILITNKYGEDWGFHRDFYKAFCTKAKEMDKENNYPIPANTTVKNYVRGVRLQPLDFLVVCAAVFEVELKEITGIG